MSGNEPSNRDPAAAFARLLAHTVAYPERLEDCAILFEVLSSGVAEIGAAHAALDRAGVQRQGAGVSLLKLADRCAIAGDVIAGQLRVIEAHRGRTVEERIDMTPPGPPPRVPVPPPQDPPPSGEPARYDVGAWVDHAASLRTSTAGPAPFEVAKIPALPINAADEKIVDDLVKKAACTCQNSNVLDGVCLRCGGIPAGALAIGDVVILDGNPTLEGVVESTRDPRGIFVDFGVGSGRQVLDRSRLTRIEARR